MTKMKRRRGSSPCNAKRTKALLNVDFTAATVLGITTMASGIILFNVRSFRPESARDTDVFFGSVMLLVGGVLVFQGWRLDPILLFGQLLTASTALYFGYEAIRLRGLETRRVTDARRSGSSNASFATTNPFTSSSPSSTNDGDEDLPGAYYKPRPEGNGPSSSPFFASGTEQPSPLATEEEYTDGVQSQADDREASARGTAAFDAGFEEGRSARLQRGVRDNDPTVDPPFDDWESTSAPR
jgi:hypothetical protein